MYEEIGMACQKVCKQVRKVKVVCKATSLHLFFFLLHTAQWCKIDVGMGEALYTTFTFMSFLTCLHTFWHAIPTSLYISNVILVINSDKG